MRNWRTLLAGSLLVPSAGARSKTRLFKTLFALTEFVYQRVVNAVDDLLQAVGLKAA